MDRSSNKDGGSYMKDVDKKRKAATSSSRKSKQPRGSSKSGAMAKHASPQKNPSKDIEF